MAILDPSVPRSGMSRVRTAVAATAVVACALMPLASLQPWAIAAAEAQRRPPGDGRTAAPSGRSPLRRRHPTPAPRDASARPIAIAGRAAPRSARRPCGPAFRTASERQRVQAALQSEHPAATCRASTAGVDTNVERECQRERPVERRSRTFSPTSTRTSPNTVDSHDAGDDQDAKGRTADPRMVAALTAALKDTDKDVRETALHALVQLRDPSIFEPLVQALGDAVARRARAGGVRPRSAARSARGRAARRRAEGCRTRTCASRPRSRSVSCAIAAPCRRSPPRSTTRTTTCASRRCSRSDSSRPGGVRGARGRDARRESGRARAGRVRARPDSRSAGGRAADLRARRTPARRPRTGGVRARTDPRPAAVEALVIALKDSDARRARAGGVRARPDSRPARHRRPDGRPERPERRRPPAGGVRARSARSIPIRRRCRSGGSAAPPAIRRPRRCRS